MHEGLKSKLFNEVHLSYITREELKAVAATHNPPAESSNAERRMRELMELFPIRAVDRKGRVVAKNLPTKSNRIHKWVWIGRPKIKKYV
ncbi:MAG: hypothetical protein NVSMB66_6400 [Candidatus Doudnabacteria bacterium]